MPLISAVQAISVIVVSIVGFALSGVLLRRPRQNRYPVRLVSSVTILVSAWLLLNVFTDRTANTFWFEVISKVAHALPQFILLVFILFIFRFPPSKRVNYLVVAGLTVLATIVCVVLAIQRDGFAVIQPGLPSINTAGRVFYLFELSYLALLLTICIVGFIKWRLVTDRLDRQVFAAILTGFAFTTLMAMASTVLTSFYPEVFYWYYPAYLSVGVFILILGFVVFRFGALQTSFSYSRTLVVLTIIAIVLLLLLTSA